MFKTERVPVTLFQSTDESAPQLTASAGSLKTILKACLVTGYGDKQPLGWESAHEDSTYIAFRSKHNKASKCWISVDNQYERAAVVTGYHEMSAKNTGENQFGEGLVKLFDSQSQNAPWVLVGHERGFCLLVRSAYQYKESCSQMIYFGDFSTLAPADNKNCILLKSGHQLSDAKYLTSAFYGVGDQIVASNSSQMPRYQSALAVSADKLGHDVTCAFASAAQAYRNATYPDFVSQGFSAFEIFIVEYRFVNNSSRYHLRGLLGGIMMIRENLSNMTDLIFFDNIDESGDRFIKFNTNDQYVGRDCFLLNSTAWEI
ncbi:hypothetical protein [Neisseria dumasiana]|uniref:Agglutinin C-terminal domain-containing protein n=1 Tax=Neisseria dumasiana TaxID=1931275 RepID=A0ABX3WN86_9NEIS|nr:hypothetical protein [Neisseria dumasiana]OSI36079.1 hypothetical protein BV913_02635 [Neisseria dumasiana]UOO83558.1 hypothetical protein LVJ88_07515 [Neisseria dumasiana]